MKLTEKLNDFWEFVRDSPSLLMSLEVNDHNANFELRMNRLLSKGGQMRIQYNIRMTTHNSHVLHIAVGHFSIGSGMHSTTMQHDASDVYNDGFLPDTNFILGRFFHHFHHFPDLPTLKLSALKSLNLQKNQIKL